MGESDFDSQLLGLQMATVEIILAARDTVMSTGIRTVLEESENVTVKHVTDRGEEAVQVAVEAPPDVILLDIGLEDVSWQHAAQTIRDADVPTKVLVLGDYGDVNQVAELLAEGVAGCIAPDDAPEVALETVSAAARDEVRFSRRTFLEAMRQERGKARGLEMLTPREREILGLLAQGFRNRRIAETLFVSEATVRNHLTRLYQKLGVASRAEAVLWAWRHGLSG